MEYRIKDFYQIYHKRGGTLDEKEFTANLKAFFKNALGSILEGNTFNMGYRLGSLRIAKYNRNFKRLVPDWGESNKYKAKLLEEGKSLYNSETGEGYKWLIYNTSSFYYGFLWKKQKIKGISFNYVLANVRYYELKTFAKTKKKVASIIDDMSQVIFEEA